MRRRTLNIHRNRFNPRTKPDDAPGMQRTIRLLFVASLAGTGLAASVGAAPSASIDVGKTEPPITQKGPEGDYLKRVHERIHARWVQDFQSAEAANVAAARSTPNDKNKAANAGLDEQSTVAFAIRWDGTIAEISVSKESGSPVFDRLAIEVVRNSAPFPLPPQDVVSDDSYTHIVWTFAHDHRACGAGAKIARVDDSLDVSLPRLVQNNRVLEGVRRVGTAVKAGSDDSLDRFARLFLAHPSADPLLEVQASVALAESGDHSQTKRLQQALTSRSTAALAARALVHLGVDLCVAVRSDLETGGRAARELALDTIRARAAQGGDISTCQESLAKVAADGQQPTALRLLVLETLIKNIPSAAKAAIAAAMEDKDPGVRGAGLSASVRKGGGRPEMYRLAPLLHDKAVEIRAAASAGIVRAAGDLAIDQLYLLVRETDPRPAQAVSVELAQLSSPASAELLGKLLKKNHPAIQLAAAQALVHRKDAAAKALLAQLPSDVSADVVALIHDGAAPSTKSAVAGSTPPTTPAADATKAVEALLRQKQGHEAAGWIVDHWASFAPSEAINVLGLWLKRGELASTPAAAAADGTNRDSVGANRTASAVP